MTVNNAAEALRSTIVIAEDAFKPTLMSEQKKRRVLSHYQIYILLSLHSYSGREIQQLNL